MLSFGRLRQRIVLKCVPHVQHDYFSSFNQSDHCFLASSLPLPSSLRKLPNSVGWQPEISSMYASLLGIFLETVQSNCFYQSKDTLQRKRVSFEACLQSKAIFPVAVRGLKVQREGTLGTRLEISPSSSKVSFILVINISNSLLNIKIILRICPICVNYSND